jgi:hypothetical protein
VLWGKDFFKLFDIQDLVNNVYTEPSELTPLKMKKALINKPLIEKLTLNPENPTMRFSPIGIETQGDQEKESIG